VLRVSSSGNERVYDLTVEGEHEFFANGVLVHNCLRYLVMAKPFWANRPCGKTQWDGAELPPPPPTPEPEILTPDQENFRVQMERSARLAGPLMRRRIRN
jgi:hypothetical protein